MFKNKRLLKWKQLMEITRLALYVTIPRKLYNEEETDFLQIITALPSYGR